MRPKVIRAMEKIEVTIASPLIVVGLIAFFVGDGVEIGIGALMFGMGVLLIKSILVSVCVKSSVWEEEDW